VEGIVEKQESRLTLALLSCCRTDASMEVDVVLSSCSKHVHFRQDGGVGGHGWESLAESAQGVVRGKQLPASKAEHSRPRLAVAVVIQLGH